MSRLWHRFKRGVSLFWAAIEGRTVDATFGNADGEYEMVGKVVRRR